MAGGVYESSELVAVTIAYKFLFNFSVSYSGGGYKRLYEYVKWFDARGGACFIVHPRCAHLLAAFQNNHYFVVKQSPVGRLYDDCGYLRNIATATGEPDLYYSFGIPLYAKVGKINWFNLCNVLPLRWRGVPLSVVQRLKAIYLGGRIKAGFAYADVISAESAASLALIECDRRERLFLSVNGSDDELADLRRRRTERTQDIAAVVGTAAYKRLKESFVVFERLRGTCPALKLMVIGNPKWVPRALRRKKNVIIRGLLPRADVIDCLRQAKYYISTTCTEGSYNAAAEGIYSADESYISDIGPHRELLANESLDEEAVPGVSVPLLHVRRSALSGTCLRSWDTVVVEMIDRYRKLANDRRD